MKEKEIKIFYVEDDEVMNLLVSNYLKEEGFHIKKFIDGENAFEHFLKNPQVYDLCILDCMLPGKDGFTLASEIKKINKNCPIIFLTARSMKEDKIKGFKIGIDDYITKPFDEEELLFRIKSILRRTGAYNDNVKNETVFEIGKYIFDYNNLSLTINNTTKRITKKEGQILHFLCLHKNTVQRRDEILISIWGQNDYFLGRSLDVFITKIRKYLKDDEDIRIENIHNVGYILNDKSVKI